MTTFTRPATPQDVPELAEIDAYVQHLHHEQHPDIWRKPDLPASIQFFQDQMRRDTTTVVIVVDNAIAGYVLYRIDEKEESRHKYSTRILALEHIAVHKRFEGRGLGKQLLEHAKSVVVLQELDGIELSVWRFNDHAIEFYERNRLVALSQKMQWRNLENASPSTDNTSRTPAT